jgi:hypothetical protein
MATGNDPISYAINFYALKNIASGTGNVTTLTTTAATAITTP